MRHHIRAVLLELDGVVANTAAYHYRAWKRLADEEGWDIEPHMAESLAGVPRMECLDSILQCNNVDLPAERRAALASRKNAYFVELLLEITERDLAPGTAAFMDALKARGVKLGLYSLSSSASIVAERLGLARWFDAVVTGSDVRYADWSPQMFEAIARTLRVPPFHCLTVGSSPAGLRSAQAARMKTLAAGARARGAGPWETAGDLGTVDVDFLLDSGRLHRWPVEEWRLTETTVTPGRARYWETLFALSNGLLGLRGAQDEDDPVFEPHSYPGMFVNGIYGYQPYRHVVEFPGFAKRLHVMLNLADWRVVRLTVDGERFSLFAGKVEEYRRSLDMRRGVVERSLVWTSPRGRRVRIRSVRLVSMVRRHCAAIRYEATPLDGAASIVFESVVRGGVASEELGAGQTRIEEAQAEADVLTLRVRPVTAEAGVGMAFAVRLTGGTPVQTGAVDRADDTFTAMYEVAARKGQAAALVKYAAFYSSVETPAGEVVERARADALRAAGDGFNKLLAEQEKFWEAHWRTADVEIEGAPGDQQALRLALFHLRQSNPEDDRRSIGANGMTGDKYRGHVFWDTEMYLTPYFLYTAPQIVRPLLMYRYNLLDMARQRAREMDGTGALFAWNSISGEECGVVFEASTAEYHLLSAIAYAIWRYTEAVADRDFLFNYGAEVLFETARFLEGRGCYVPHKGGRFCINVVCGPDEYGCGVNNNCYTNVMAQWHLRYAAEVYGRMREQAPQTLDDLAGRIGLQPAEVERWRQAAERMYVPFNRELGIHEQDDSFLSLDPVDMALVPRNTDIRDTMHPLNLWRMQVAKQADVVLLMFVQGHQFAPDVKKANYEFYEPRTCHGSSLSASIHAIVAAEIGKLDEAYEYFRESAMMDLHDFKDNTGGGMHMACLGGTWMAVVNGFAGMRDYPDGLHFAPSLPAQWKGYRFQALYRGSRIRISVGPAASRFELVEGPDVAFDAAGQRVTLTADHPAAEVPTRRRM